MARVFRRAVSGKAILLIAAILILLFGILGLPAAFDGPRSSTLFSIPRLWVYGLFGLPVALFICLKVTWRNLDRTR